MTSKRVALVTGANRGIGRETALQLARDHGMKVYVGSRHLGAGQQAAAQIGHGTQALELDVSDDVSVARALAEIAARDQQLDVVVNNAGTDYDTDQRAYNADLNRVRSCFATNLFGAWSVVIQSVPLLKKSDQARIVNVSSGGGSLSGMGGGFPGYGVSKAALNALTLKLADELRRDQILVNAVCPGWVATDMGGGGRPIPDGARGVVWAATLPRNGPTGGFFRDGEPIDW